MKYEKGFAPLVTILLIVLGIGVVGGGYVLYKDKQQQKKLEAQIQDLQNQPVGDAINITAPKVVDKNPSSTTEKLVITFPTKGAVLVEGQTYNITWIGTDNSTGTYSVYLDNKNVGSFSVGESNIPTSKNSVSLTVPYLEYGGEGSVAPGDSSRDSFRIMIFTSGAGVEKMKKYYSPEFKIISPGHKNPIIILHPAVGEILRLGSRYNIQWRIHTFDSANAQYSLTLVDSMGNITPIGTALRGSEELVNFDWLVPTSIVAKDWYVIKIQQNIDGEPVYTSSSFRIGN
jgi:hypothetical protein